ncbi:MAG: hypothetical protein KC766_12425 [Myxococcales bacterium]|nr:hypothetical protein [Myxococcales bacterium]
MGMTVSLGLPGTVQSVEERCGVIASLVRRGRTTRLREVFWGPGPNQVERVFEARNMGSRGAETRWLEAEEVAHLQQIVDAKLKRESYAAFSSEEVERFCLECVPLAFGLGRDAPYTLDIGGLKTQAVGLSRSKANWSGRNKRVYWVRRAHDVAIPFDLVVSTL